MKRNGFTLVEMMAVIVLLSVLTVIGVATYTNVNESAKNKSLESKREEIRSSAMKWARENNITNKTVISVNALVVEGYLTADENKMGEIGKIENPVTGENMICNTVDIFFKEGEMVADVNDTVQNCDLVTQSLIDENIEIKVIDENNVNKTGSKSMSNWTNKNVLIVVSSTEYDPNAVSISFDFEGNTKTNMISGSTQYTGDRYLTKDAAKSYYNVFNVYGNLLLDSKVVVTYNMNDGTTKSRAYSIRIDKEEATASIKANNAWLTTDKPIYVTVDDGKGSGAKGFIISTDDDCRNIIANQTQVSFDGTPVTLDIGKYYIWTEDNAGNRSEKPKVIFEVNNVDRTVPWCEVYFEGTIGDHGWFKEDPVQPYGRNNAEHLAGLSGFNLGVNQSENSPEYSTYAEYDTYNAGQGELRDTNTVKAGEMYYCHAKTLAGNYSNNSARLYLDMTPPTISIEVTNPNVHTKTKDATISLYDALSGLNATTNVKIGFSLSATGGPTTWETVAITAPEQTNQVISKTVTVGSTLTGTYYLYIDTSSFTDYAGNYPDPPAMSNGEHMFVYGPYKFDNTPPVCNGVGGKTNWTKGTYTVNQYCLDNYGTTDQSLCSQDPFTKDYGDTVTIKTDTIVISDNAGNTTVCPTNVYLDNTPPVCNGVGGKTNWTKGTYTVNQYCTEDNVNQSGCARDPFTRDYGTNETVKTDTLTISDAVGNTTVCPTNVYLDNSAPSCGSATGENTTYTRTPQTVIVGCTEDSFNQSGCSQLVFSKTHSDTTITDTIVISDNVDNQTVCGPFNYYVDVTPPSCGSASGQNSTYRRNPVTITVQCSDAHSGCTQSSFNRTWSSTTVTDYVTMTDRAGNVAYCGPYNVYVDTSGPVCGAKSGEGFSWSKGTRTISVGCSDAHSGCVQSPVTHTFTGSMRTSSITIRDKLGNTTNCPVSVYLDNTAPSCSGNKSNIGSKSGVNINVSCSDAHSGVKSCNGGNTSFSNQKTGGSYTVTDNVGNTGSCSTSVTSYGCDCTTHSYSTDCTGSDVKPGSSCTKHDADSPTGICYQSCTWVECKSTCYQ